MSQTVALHMPEELYEALRKQAAKKGQTPDALLIELVSHAIQETEAIEADPLVKLFGTIHSDISDIAERHDDYIGQSLAREQHDRE